MSPSTAFSSTTLTSLVASTRVYPIVSARCFGNGRLSSLSTKADWLIGKDIIGPAALAQGYTCLRDMANPAAKHCLAPQPTQYRQFKSGMDPHLSSGIPNLAFYTIAKAVGGNSWEKVGQIWYRSMTGFGLTPSMGMKSFANRTRAVATQLYPGDTALASAVDGGWKKVGL